MKNNNLEKIYNKLPKDKTLLKAELAKVELAIADDIKAVVSQIKAKRDQLQKVEKSANEYRKRMSAMYKEGAKMEKLIEKESQSGNKLVDKAIKISDKAEKAAKDLGVDPNNIGGYKELDDQWGELEVDASVITDLLRELYD